MPRKTVTRVTTTTVFVVLALLVLLEPTRRAFISTAVTINLLVPKGSWRPLQWTTPAPTWRDIETKTANGQAITVRLFEPQKSSRLGLVVYTPLIGGGLDDERLVNLGITWARAGIPVAVPWSENGLAIRTDDTEEVIAAAYQLQEHTDTAAVGLFGISYGNGPTFHAAIDPRLSDSAAAIVSLNGMYDLMNVVTFIESGQSHEYGREVVAATRAAGTTLTDVRDNLSPITTIDQLTLPVYVIHSTSDQFIPYSESVQLYETLQAKEKASLLVLTDVIDHGTYRPLTPTNLFTRYLPAGWGFARIVYEILSLR